MHLCNYQSLTLLIAALFNFFISDIDRFYMTTNCLRTTQKNDFLKLIVVKASI